MQNHGRSNREISHVKHPRVDWFNTLRPRQNGNHFEDDIFKCIFVSNTFRLKIHWVYSLESHWQYVSVGSSYHYCDVIMGEMASQITSTTNVYSTVYSGADQRKYQSSESLVFLRGNSPVTGEFPAQMASGAENVSIWWRHRVNGDSHEACLLSLAFIYPWTFLDPLLIISRSNSSLKAILWQQSSMDH